MNNALINMTATPLTMSSREIADLTGKRHDNVMIDIRNMLGELGTHAPEFSGTYRSDRGNTDECFNLPYRETTILLTGYSVPMRAKVVDRWTELEAQITKPAFQLPQTMGLRWLRLSEQQS